MKSCGAKVLNMKFNQIFKLYGGTVKLDIAQKLRLMDSM